MGRRKASLTDKFDLAAPSQLLTGTQAIVRLVLMQKERDTRAGLKTAGYVTGYRGSPIATLESAFERAKALVETNEIVFQPGLNEDLAATAVWGTQQAELRNEGRYDGVFAVWYGKGPGVDRSGDAFRHANHAGTSKNGGVIALMGDDHTCESSTSAHQSEFAFVDAMIPILNPAGVQEILDYGLYGFALSRFAGVWVGIKCVKDNIESTATVDGRLDRVTIRLPDEAAFTMPAGGLNIRLGDSPLAKEARLHDYKRAAILAFSRSNHLDRVVMSGGQAPRLGIVTAGKSYLDTRQALDELGIDEVRANVLGVRLYKVAMTWPLEPRGIERFAQGLDQILVIEEKRSLIETQVKEQLFDTPVRPRVFGKKDEKGNWLFPAKGALDPIDIAVALGERILSYEADEELARRVAEIRRLRDAKALAAEAFTRIPYFCAGCPHNTSTVVPEGARAMAGIGCHYMALWMDRSTEGFTQMGAEGASWIGEAPFSARPHVFQNLGDGTYVHSGSLAIRAAAAAGVSITFKILFNDAVAMTGGQRLDGGLTVPDLAAQVLAEGVERVVIATDEPEKYARGELPGDVAVHHRRNLDQVQRDLAAVRGVTVLIYDQTCAAEKRRRRKRGLYPDPDRRVFINAEVCEGCGDCGVKSNCVAVLPLETQLGRKRQIDQSACNKDFSCLEGFCPSFVTLEGARPRKAKAAPDLLPRLSGPLPEPVLPVLDRPYAMLATGVGGTGVVTISAVLAQAAYLAGLGFGSIDMTGLAQKGGAVGCHMRVARTSEEIHAIRVGTAHADLVLGGDLVVTASNKVLETIRPDHTAVVYSRHEMTTGDFTRDPDLDVPGAVLETAIANRTGRGPSAAIDAHALALRMFGDSIFANMLLLGFAYQMGRVPISSSAIEEAIGLNGAAVETNRQAFRLGRLAAYDPAALGATADMRPERPARCAPLDEIIALRVDRLTAFQNRALADRYRSRVAALAALEGERIAGTTRLTETVAQALYKLLAYKDEYEVARLYSDGRFAQSIDERFEGVRRIEFHLAPPLLGRLFKDKSGHPRKLRFGPWMQPVFRLLAKGKVLRGTPWDPFGYSAERRRERAMIADYERLLDEIAVRLAPETHAAAVALAALPLKVRGFGHVKETNYRAMKREETELLTELRGSPSTSSPALKAAE